MICSYGDKTFFFATCDSDEHCSMDATVVLCCLSLYLHVAGDYDRSWKKFWVLEGPAIYFGQDSGNPGFLMMWYTVYGSLLL